MKKNRVREKFNGMFVKVMKDIELWDKTEDSKMARHLLAIMISCCMYELTFRSGDNTCEIERLVGHNLENKIRHGGYYSKYSRVEIMELMTNENELESIEYKTALLCDWWTNDIHDIVKAQFFKGDLPNKEADLWGLIENSIKRVVDEEDKEVLKELLIGAEKEDE